MKNKIRFAFLFMVLILSFIFLKIEKQNQNKEKIEKEFENIKACKNDTCYEEFFENYTIENGVPKAISLFKNLIKEKPEYEGNCHYMFHGIGHGAFKVSGNDNVKAFAIGSSTDVLMNIPTCGNGYYHGVIEAYVGEEEQTEKDLKNKLEQLCINIPQNQVKIDCYHGLGHAILVHEAYQVPNAVSLCDKVTKDETMKSMCHTGVFMEMLRDQSVENKVLTFSKCENLPTEMQRAECFNQHSYLLNDFLSNKDKFIENMLFCEKSIKDMEERIICIRKEKL